MAESRYATGIYRPGTQEAHVLTEPRGAKRDGTSVGVIAVHGHGANALTFAQAGFSSGLLPVRLADAGFTTLSVDAGGPSPWADDDEMLALDAALAYLRTLNVDPGPVCVLGWSMGGLASLNWIKRNPAKVRAAVVYAPAVDIAYFHNGGNATYRTEIEADYGGSAAWATGIAGHSPAAEPANYRGLPPIRIYHGDADTTVPLTQTQSFAAAVADPRLVVHPVPGKDHVTVFDGVSADDVAAFFSGGVAA